MKLVKLTQDTEMVKYYSSFNSVHKTQIVDQKDRTPTSPTLIQIQMGGLMILVKSTRNKND